MPTVARCVALAMLFLTVLFACQKNPPAPSSSAVKAPAVPTLNVLVSDPLSNKIACACVAGYATRDYGALAAHLEKQLSMKVNLAYAGSVQEGMLKLGGAPDLIIGKDSLMDSDAKKAKLAMHRAARLTDKEGSTELVGLFVVRSSDSATELKHLDGRRILFGPDDENEKSAAAMDALKAAGAPKWSPQIAASCDVAAMGVVEKKADVGVVSSYAMPLLEGCGTIDKMALRIVGKTKPVPFITVFINKTVGAREADIRTALQAMSKDKKTCTLMESKDGFILEPTTLAQQEGTQRPFESTPRRLTWPGWRGVNRDGLTEKLPSQLPAQPKILWEQKLSAPGVGGISATEQFVILGDKEGDEASAQDVWRCFDALTGKPVWILRYSSARGTGEEPMDYGDGPRASPVIRNNRVYLWGARAHLHCVDLATGNVLWKKNLAKAYSGPIMAWGFCSTPLVVGDKIILNPGGPKASVVALDLTDGREIWKTPAAPDGEAGYGSFIVASFGRGAKQVIGHDRTWSQGIDLATGRRLWQNKPDRDRDFNVPTPIALTVAGETKLLLATENNGTRLHSFNDAGLLRTPPDAVNEDLHPETASPTLLNNRIYGVSGKLFCLDVPTLKIIWKLEDPAFTEHASLIADPDGRLLILGMNGDLVLVQSQNDKPVILSRCNIADKSIPPDCWAHPALLHTNTSTLLYARTALTLKCLQLN